MMPFMLAVRVVVCLFPQVAGCCCEVELIDERAVEAGVLPSNEAVEDVEGVIGM